MTPEEIKAKSLELAALYTAKANGKTLQYDAPSLGYSDACRTDGPTMGSNLSRWRVKPEPRTFWVLLNQDGEVIDATKLQLRADYWRRSGYDVVESKEVLP